MIHDRYIHHISFLPQKDNKEPEEPAKDNSDEVAEIEKDNHNETSNPEASQEKTE